ncbi:MAG: uroporphyrinogen decarboxylase family protein [Clostridiales bacterium]|nr:uroporphyrinogen decarboxylase family protein [Clostridiales bacterium]
MAKAKIQPTITHDQFSTETNEIGAVNLPVTEKDRQRILSLGREWAGLAASDEMSEKKRWWKAANDLEMEVPLVMFEPYDVVGFIVEEDIQCEHPLLRNVERLMLYQLKQVKFVKDDAVLENWFRIPWRIKSSGFGIDIEDTHVEGSIAYRSNFPLRTPEDISKLTPCEYIVDRERSLELKKILEDIWGDILPVRIGNVDWYFPDYGYNPFTGNYVDSLTANLFRLLGFERWCLWMVDSPDDIHAICRFLTDDRIRFFKWLEDEQLLDFSNDSQFVVPSGYGYMSGLPGMDSPGPARLKDIWGWMSSQEGVVLSPAMFEEFVLPYLSEMGGMFGVNGYACCEPVEDRIELVKKWIPNVRNFSVTHWNKSPERVAELIGSDFVYITKPLPAFLSGPAPDWDSAKKELERHWACAKGLNVEFTVRDAIDVRDHETLPKWVELCKSIVGR